MYLMRNMSNKYTCQTNNFISISGALNEKYHPCNRWNAVWMKIFYHSFELSDNLHCSDVPTRYKYLVSYMYQMTNRVHWYLVTVSITRWLVHHRFLSGDSFRYICQVISPDMFIRYPFDICIRCMYLVACSSKWIYQVTCSPNIFHWWLVSLVTCLSNEFVYQMNLSGDLFTRCIPNVSF